jgi:predicted short-subunit dehydrogenase-like oxidoreductase (DUF2520 family)
MELDHLDPAWDWDGGLVRDICAVLAMPAAFRPRCRAHRGFFMTATLDRERDKMRTGALPGPVGFIGAGRVGTALSALLHARGIGIAGVSGRTPRDARRMASEAGLNPLVARNRSETLRSSAIVFLTVPDDSIAVLCREIADEGGWREGQGVVHCSGALSSDVLQPARDMGALTASFHPLQAFASLDAALANLPGSTFALEGDEALVGQLDTFVRLLGGTALHLQAEDKILYHAAAAIASNYTVTLAALAADLLVREGVAADANKALHYLMPLLRGTIENLDNAGLPGALTGPIARGDAGTVVRHLEALEKCSPEMAHLYRHLARLTLPLAIKKGGLDENVVRQLNELLD